MDNNDTGGFVITQEGDDPPSRRRVLDDALTDSPPSGLCLLDPDLPTEFAITYYENSDLESVDDEDFDWDAAITARYGATEVVESKSKGRGKNKIKRRGNVLEGPDEKPTKRAAPLTIEQKIRLFQEHRRLNKWKPAPKIFSIDEIDDFADSDDDEDETASWVSCSDTSSWSKASSSNVAPPPLSSSPIPLSPSPPPPSSTPPPLSMLSSLVIPAPLSPSLLSHSPSHHNNSNSNSNGNKSSTAATTITITTTTTTTFSLPSLVLPPSTFSVSHPPSSLHTKPLSPPPPPSSSPSSKTTIASSSSLYLSSFSTITATTASLSSTSSVLSQIKSSASSPPPPPPPILIPSTSAGEIRTRTDSSLRSPDSSSRSLSPRGTGDTSPSETSPRSGEDMDGMLATLRELVLQKQKALGAAVALVPGASLEQDARSSPILEKLTALQQAMRYR